VKHTALCKRYKQKQKKTRNNKNSLIELVDPFTKNLGKIAHLRQSKDR